MAVLKLVVENTKEQLVFSFWDLHCFLGLGLFSGIVGHWVGHVRDRSSCSPFFKKGATGDKFLRYIKGHYTQIIKIQRGK